MEGCRSKQMKLDKLTHPGCEDTAEDFRERDRKYGTVDVKVPAVVKLQPDDSAGARGHTTSGEHME